MPKHANVIFYKVFCKSPGYIDGFVGRTINLSQKKHYHKINCTNPDKACTLYTNIRKNGGWDNWTMVKIETLPFTDEKNMQELEEHYMKKFSYTLSVEHIRNYFCECCKLDCFKKNNFEKHCRTVKHQKLSNSEKQGQSESDQLREQLQQKDELLQQYDLNEKVKIDLLQMQNNVLTKQLVELSKEKNITTNSNNNNTNNSHCTNNMNNTNNKFNLNFFLNETCKDAVNLGDFIKQIKCQVEDLVFTGEAGFPCGITSILQKNLRQLAENKRPVYCSDLKRETMYIKENGVWEKENADKSHIMDAVRHVARCNLRNLQKWTDDHPLHRDYNSTQNTQYMHMIGNAMPGMTDDEIERSYKKIIHNLALEVSISKDPFLTI